MMLIRSSIDPGLPSVHDHGKQNLLCVWIPDNNNKSWPQQPNPIPKFEHKTKTECLLSSSQLSTEINTSSETSMPNFVYKRRKIQKDPILPPSRSSTPTIVYKRKKGKTVIPAQVSTNTRESDNCIIEEPKHNIQKCSELRAINDTCSSSKSNTEIGECSSSGTNSCILFLEKHRVVFKERFSTKKFNNINSNTINDINCCLKACKVCERESSTLKMIICDICEEAYHVSCCNPVVKKAPSGDWFCHFCVRKKVKKIKETNSRKAEDYLGPIRCMLRDVDNFKSNVPIGKDFQAEVPDWSGPLINEADNYREFTELNPLECPSFQNWDSSKLSRLSSIGNWLQCREVVDSVNETLCGKWRRAPLFEVQTDHWECFSSVLWDPTHADCAVPQELDTDQVLKQLKYIEMLRPRLSVKRWKLGINKGVDREEHTEDPRNTQKS